MINARAETLTDKPTFARLLVKRRCLIVADGIYEWRQVEGRKQPVYIHMKDQSPFVFAGLWGSAPPESGNPQSYGTIITSSANRLIAPVHDRMPVILPPSAIDAWLDPRFKDVGPLLQPYPDEAMAWYPVSGAINSPRSDGSELIRALAG